MKTTCLFIVLLFTALTAGWSAEVHEFTDLGRPATLIVKFDKIYILEQATIRIYSLKDFKHLKTFGKAGEGPGEFKINFNDARPLSMAFSNGKLMVNSLNKVSWFDPDGSYLSEQHMAHDMLMFPIRGQYVGIGPMSDEKNRHAVLGFKFYKGDMSPGKVLFRTDLEMNNPNRFILPMTTFNFNPVYKDRIYINTSSSEFIIDVFNKDGEKVQSIKKDYRPLKTPSNFRQTCLDFFRDHPRWKNMFELFKKMLVVRNFFPPIRDMQIADGILHVITYERKDGLWQCVMFDLEGNEIDTKYVPLDRYIPFTFYPILYSIYKGNMYSLVEDLEEETWRLHAINLR